jgi:hypothetical protein
MEKIMIATLMSVGLLAALVGYVLLVSVAVGCAFNAVDRYWDALGDDDHETAEGV